MKVLLFGVNYNSYDKVVEFLDSLEKSAVNAKADITVVISDNSEKEKKINNTFKGFELIHVLTHKNLGYLGAVSFSIENCRINLECYDYIIISNVDLTVEKDFFNKLSDISVNEDVGCIAPSIISVTEKFDRNPKMVNRITKLKLQMLKVMYSVPLLYKLNYKYISNRKYKHQKYSEMRIYAPHGSFMIFTKKFSAFLQSFKFPAFLFGEEIYFAENLRKMGLTVEYYPKLIIKDYEHVNTGQLKNTKRLKWSKHGIEYFLKEYF